MGGVAVNLKNSGEIQAAVEKMKTALGGGMKFLVQKFLKPGRELIIGAKASEGTGHILMFGLGGIFVEVLKDVAFAISPVSDTEAMEMISSIKASALIDGFRGEKGINREKATEVIQRVSMLCADFPAIRELDLNPLFAIDDAICAVDARIIL